MSIAKGAMALGGVGSVAGGGFLAHSLMSQNNQKSALVRKLESDKFTLLNFDTARTEAPDSSWKKILTSYSKLIQTKSELKIGDLALTENDQEGINKLKNACSSILKVEEASSDFTNNYKLASKWCVEPISVGDLLSKRGSTYLDTSDSANKTKWTEVAKRYEVDKKASKNTLMSDVTWADVTSENYDTNIGHLKTACNTRKSKNSHEDDFERSLEEAQSWCVNHK
ncbi:hypothetical protein HF1_13160 [Mycoplasma haemofelis str. Langford 1]|uniref:Uncharacterized protein n=1 Tax=Mycoplasma haemofelis (strain Langford 1) TaxID=941640 RepID=E8ZJK3_MYCHL|nr:hypothetical protein [Mycoplasma haemofelis]CBY93324.1 hypothetical protein HF1_13160 [Mycoplasma haemofelis str. Langford 1]